MRITNFFIVTLFLFNLVGCTSSKKETMEDEKAPYQLMTLDPGHFHATLVQKMQLDDVDKTVYVFAPEGSDVQDHLNRIKGFNTRTENPTNWVEENRSGSSRRRLPRHCPQRPYIVRSPPLGPARRSAPP